MKRALWCAMMALAVASETAGYTNFYYRSDADCGNVGWGDARRWDRFSRNSGDHAVPGEGADDVIRIDCDARVTDSDWATFSKLNELVLSSKANLTLDFTEDRTWNGSFQGSNARVVKLNANYFKCTRGGTAMQLKGGTFVVSNGVFRISGCFDSYCSVYDVVSPGVLELPASEFYLGALMGNGTVSNAVNNQQVVFMGEIMTNWWAAVLDKGPYVFSGTFAGSVPITTGRQMGKTAANPFVGYFGALENQSFTGLTPGLPASSPRFMHGVLSMAHFGGSGAAGGSVGNYDVFNIFGMVGDTDGVVGIRYCGTGAHASDRGYQIYNNAIGSIGLIDGGTHGDLTYNGTIENRQAATGNYPGLMTRLVFDGAAGTNAFGGKMTHYTSVSNSFVVQKQGASTWRFTGNAGYRGPTEITRGTLSVANVRPAGETCSLGYADLLLTNYYAATAAAPATPFAQTLGDGSVAVSAATGTLAYEGGKKVSLDRRATAICGAGRLANTGTGALHVEDIASVTPGANTLVLSGTGTENFLYNTTNAAQGTLDLLKEGAGTWHLGGRIDLNAVTVKEGALSISTRYAWYRLNLRESFGGLSFGFRVFGLWDAAGNLITADMTENELTCTDTGRQLMYAPGESGLACTNDVQWYTAKAHWGNGAIGYSNTTDPLNPVGNAYFRICVEEAGRMRNDVPDSWVRIVMRLPMTAAAPACYDFRAEEYASNANTNFEMRCFSMDASVDGVHWDELHAETNHATSWGSAGNWHSCGKATRTNADGFRLSASRATFAVSDFAKVRVDAGASFAVDSVLGVKTAGLVLDAAGGGTLTGVTFAQAGTLDIVNLRSEDLGRTIPFAFENGSGWENVANWNLTVEGAAPVATRFRVTADGVKVFKRGATLFVR